MLTPDFVVVADARAVPSVRVRRPVWGDGVRPVATTDLRYAVRGGHQCCPGSARCLAAKIALLQVKELGRFGCSGTFGTRFCGSLFNISLLSSHNTNKYWKILSFDSVAG